jgi:hypothetical protein
MGVTSNGLPYPENSDFVSDGAMAIKDLAEKITDIYPRGIVALVASTSIAFGLGSAQTVTLTTPSFTAVANRYYRLTYHEPRYFASSTGLQLTHRIRLTNTSGAIYGSSSEKTEQFIYQAATVTGVTTLSAGATVLVATIQLSAGTASYDRNGDFKAFLMVEDIGKA